MNIALFSFTESGAKLACQLKKQLMEHGHTCHAYTLEKFAFSSSLTALTTSLSEQVAVSFSQCDALVFISACGIAVRSIAPYLQSKTTDPCVLCIDETGQYVISLLSGHLGGGNALAQEVASYLYAIPVITTATDLNDVFSVDLFAKQNDLALSDMTIAKEISALLLQHQEVGIESMLPFASPLPNGLIKTACQTNAIQAGIYIGYKQPILSPFPHTLYLTPKQVTIGIGCRKHISFDAIQAIVLRTLKEHQVSMDALYGVASIDLKKEETALLQFCETYQLPFFTFSANQLQRVEGSRSYSTFVESITGVDTVCERAALALAKSDTLLVPKTSDQGVTVALALRSISITF